MASTSEVYGDPEMSPQAEDYWGRVNPFDRAGCRRSQTLAEAITVLSSLSPTGYAYRPHLNTYGPGMRPHDGRVISNFIVQALEGKDLTIYGEGTRTRSFCYVSDLVEGILRLLFTTPQRLKQRLPGAEDVHLPVNLGNPTELRIVEIATLIARLTGSSIAWSATPCRWTSKCQPAGYLRARRLLGWQPRIGLEEGLHRTIDYFRNLKGSPKEVAPSF